VSASCCRCSSCWSCSNQATEQQQLLLHGATPHQLLLSALTKPVADAQWRPCWQGLVLSLHTVPDIWLLLDTPIPPAIAVLTCCRHGRLLHHKRLHKGHWLLWLRHPWGSG
jgi:hypothetical protein